MMETVGIICRSRAAEIGSGHPPCCRAVLF
jgi:hypothetical protein